MKMSPSTSRVLHVKVRNPAAIKALVECAESAGASLTDFVAALVLSHGRERAEAIARANGRRKR